MNFDLADDQRLLRGSVERFAGTFDLAERERIRAAAGGKAWTDFGGSSEVQRNTIAKTVLGL